jgi:DDE superfamily endonuclease
LDILPYIPTSLQEILGSFYWAFTDRSLHNFIFLVVGWLTVTGRHRISAAIRAGTPIRDKDFSAFYRFFSRASWKPDTVGEILFSLLIPWISACNGIWLILDDTLTHKSGPQVWGAAMHHDACASTYASRSGKAHKSFAFGLNFVVLAVWVPLPCLGSGRVGKHSG